MAIPLEHAWLFWDVDPAAIDFERDRRYVLGRVLEKGRLTDVRWAVSQYGLYGVRDFFGRALIPKYRAEPARSERLAIRAKGAQRA